MTAVHQHERPVAFSVRTEPDRGDIAVIARGELDIATAPELARAVTDLREAGCTALRMDLRQVTFTDSSGLRILVDLARDEELRVCVQPGPAVQRALEISGLAGQAPFA